MLPSGNDASQCLGVYFGHLMIMRENMQGSGIAGSKTDANVNEDEFIS